MEKELEDHYESLTGVRPTIIKTEHDDPKRATLKVYPDKHEIHIIAGSSFKPNTEEITKYVGKKLEDKLKDSISEIHERFTGIKPKTLEFKPEQEKGKAKLTLSKDTAIASGHMREFSPEKLAAAYSSRFHLGIPTKVYGELSPKAKRKIYTAFSMAINKLSKKNREKLKGAKFFVYSGNYDGIEDVKAAFTKGLAASNSEQDMKALESSLKRFEGGVTDSKRKHIHIVNPDKSRDLMRIVSHELHHLVEDKDKVVKQFAKQPLTRYARKYTDPVKRSRESMSDLFGHFIKYRAKQENKTKHPTMQIVGFVRKTFPGRTEKESRFKRYLIRKLHILSGTPLPRIGIKKPLQ
mgnify:CR=1 FL=1